MTQAATSAAPTTRFGPVFAVVAAGVAMSNVDVFIVNVALPAIGSDLGGAPLSSLSWVLNGYAVVFGAWLVPAGSIADRTGPRRAYLMGLAVFTLASVLCAISPGVWALVAARVLQALGAATLIPSSLGILLTTASPEQRLPAIRGWTAISGVAAAAGPAVGGLLTQADWRWVFLVNVPIGIAAIAVGLRILPSGPAPAAGGGRLDAVGAGLLTAAIAFLSLGLVEGNGWGWDSPQVVGALVASVLLAAWFAVRSARHPAPVLPLHLMRLVRVAVAANFLFAIAFAAMLLSIVLWCQQVWGWSPLRSGLAICPGPLMVPALAIGIGPVARRVGAGPVAAIGCAVFAAGIGWWIARLGERPDYPSGMLPGMLLTGIGVGIALPTLIGAAIAGLPPKSFSTGSGMVTMFRQIGAVLGVAALAAVLAAAGDVLARFDRGWELTAATAIAAGAVSLLLRRPAAAPAPASPSASAERLGPTGR